MQKLVFLLIILLSVTCHFKKKTKDDIYNEQTKKIINRVLNINSNTIDVGSYVGDMAFMMLSNAKNGKHWAIEPIPHLAQQIKKRFSKNKNVIVEQIALSNKKGQTEFNHVTSNESYSGIKQREYPNLKEKIKKIKVELDTLDNIVGDVKIDLIKIDVEGAELLVLEGSRKTLKNSKPYVIFEHGKGASEFYKATPIKVFSIFKTSGLKVNTMKRWLENKKAFTLKEFQNIYSKHLDYYFIAYP